MTRTTRRTYFIGPEPAAIAKVHAWIAEAPSERDDMGGCREVRFRNALSAGVISDAEYEAVRAYYGDLWNYTGD